MVVWAALDELGRLPAAGPAADQGDDERFLLVVENTEARGGLDGAEGFPHLFEFGLSHG